MITYTLAFEVFDTVVNFLGFSISVVFAASFKLSVYVAVVLNLSEFSIGSNMGFLFVAALGNGEIGRAHV